MMRAAAAPAAGGFLKLVSPAAVVGERRAAEEFRIVRRRLVSEEDENLAVQVLALVIVPAELGGGNAVADKNRFGVEIVLLFLGQRGADEIRSGN